MFLRNSISWLVLILLLFILFVVNLSFGSVHIPFREILDIIMFQSTVDEVKSSIMWDFRMTKALTCILSGSALSLAGLQMQTLFRNPLAGPDVLGLTSGASLVVSLIFMSNAAGIQLLALQSPWAVTTAATIGCAGVFLVMLAVARRIKDNVSLLIVGLMIGAATASVVSVLQYLSKAEEMQVYILWTFGSLGGLNWNEILVLGLVLLFGTLVSMINIKSLNAWLLGDRYAQSLGINLTRSRFYIILSASILTGGVTAFCGPIAFVGLAVPHLIKLLITTTNHRTLVPAVLAGGAALLLFCDILTQLPTSYVLPINAITAMIGAPVVIWVILRNKKIVN